MKIISSCPQIFSLCLPGVTVVVPVFLLCIKSLFVGGGLVTVESEISAVAIINSLICYPYHFGNVGYSCLQGNFTIDYTVEEIRNEISATLLCVLKRASNTENKLAAICGACVLLFEDLSRSKPRKDILTQFLSHLLSLTNSPSDVTAQTTLDILSAMSLLYHHIVELDKTLISTIITNLCENLRTLLQDKPDVPLRENVVLAHFWAIIEWVIPLSPDSIDWISSADNLSKLLQVIELGFYGSQQIYESAENDLARKGKKISHVDRLKDRSKLIDVKDSRNFMPPRINFKPEWVLFRKKEEKDGDKSNTENANDNNSSSENEVKNDGLEVPKMENAQEGPQIPPKVKV